MTLTLVIRLSHIPEGGRDGFKSWLLTVPPRVPSRRGVLHLKTSTYPKYLLKLLQVLVLGEGSTGATRENVMSFLCGVSAKSFLTKAGNENE